jgi:hypothetical protein
MGQINLHESLDFPGVVPPSRLNNFAWSPHLKSHYLAPAMQRGIKIVRQLIYVSKPDRNLFKELKEPKPLIMQYFCKNEKEKH